MDKTTTEQAIEAMFKEGAKKDKLIYLIDAMPGVQRVIAHRIRDWDITVWTDGQHDLMPGFAEMGLELHGSYTDVLHPWPVVYRLDLAEPKDNHGTGARFYH